MNTRRVIRGQRSPRGDGIESWPWSPATLSGKPKILVVGEADDQADRFLEQADDRCDVVAVRTPLRALARLARDNFSAVYVVSPHVGAVSRLGRLLENERLLDALPDGVALLDADHTIIWANQQFHRWCSRDAIAGQAFYAALGNPEILGPDFSPFRTVETGGPPSCTTLRTADGRFLQVHVARIEERNRRQPEPAAAKPPSTADGSVADQAAANDGSDPALTYLIVSLRDVTKEMLHQQKLARIHAAGARLNELKPEELVDMPIDDRIELLKQNILQCTKDVLNFDVVEIRLLSKRDGEPDRLEPLLAVGMTTEAASRNLFARTQNNGVTGFVAATGKSYLCEDTTHDPHYLQGCEGAKSSLTVPLILNDEVIGTFNVESREPRAFTDSDLQFVEIFCRDLAVAINTLEMLAVERAIVAAEGTEAIHSAVAMPVDEILNDAVNVMENYIGHDPLVAERLQRILRNARDIKEVIQKVGHTLSPSDVLPVGLPGDQRPHLRGRRILVADADDAVRGAAHKLLERYGCIVETAKSAGETVCMVRNTGADAEYDVIIADIRLPDMSGYELLMKLKSMTCPTPLVLMTGFGYDAGHSIVKARQAGLREVLYKPFRLDQLLGSVERTVGEGGMQA